jgi:pheromone shutdown protein TraB
MEPLILVGTVHLDPDGYDRLGNLLFELKPETVCVDVSQYALEFRRTVGREYRSLLDNFRREDGSLPPALAAVDVQLQIPFEYRAADDYAERRGARVVPVGDSAQSQKLLGHLSRELMTTDNLVELASREEPPLKEQVEKEWERAHRYYRQGSSAAVSLERTDKRLANQLREYAGRESVVHVGGWEHLKGLSDLLAEFEPDLRLLSPPS